MANPVRFTSGVATASPGTFFANYPYPDPFHTGNVHKYENDFNTLSGTDFTVTGTSSTFAIGNGNGGVAVLTPGGITTASSAYKNGTSFQFTAGQPFWFGARFQVSALAGTEYVGLQAGSSANDGLWFAVDATGVVSLYSVVGSTGTTLVTSVTTATAATYVDVGFYYDGTDLLVFVADQLVARVSSPTIGSSATTLTNALLTPVVQITPTATQTVTVDYIVAASGIVR